MGDLLKVVFYLGIAGYCALNFFSAFMGYGKDITYKVKSNTNIANVKIVELEVKNTSSKWLDYTFTGSNVDVYSGDFTILDESDEVLDADGRSDDGIQNLRRDRKRVIQLVFVDDQNKIDQYDSLDIYSDTEKIEKTITLPEAVHMETDAELLQKALTTTGPEQDAAMKEFKDRVMSELTGQ